MNPPSPTLAILAGGEGVRMGRPKGNLRIGGTPILTYLLEQFAWAGPTLLVTAPGREHPTGWEDFGREIVDPVAGQGPVRGILSALESVPAGIVVVTTVDMPMVRPVHLDWLAKELANRPELLGVLLRRGEQIEPFPSTFRMEAREALTDHLAQGRRSVHSLLERPGFLALDAPKTWSDQTWLNLNYPDDLNRLEMAI